MKYFILFLLSFSSNVFAGSYQSISYQGRILKPDNSPLEALTSFRFEIKAPSSGCILWRDERIINMTSTLGALSAEIGLVANASSGTHSFKDVFDNTKTLTSLTGTSCSGTYTPLSADENRELTVSFDDGSGPQNISAIKINAVPYSLFSQSSANALGLGTVAVALTAPTSGQVLQYNSGLNRWEPATVGGTGTVTSVDLYGSSIFNFSGGPITTNGSINVGLASVASGNFVLASPNGGAGVPTFRAMVANDIPNLAATKITSGTLSAAVGGTGLVPVAGDANKVFAVNSAGTGTEFKTITAGSGIVVNTGTAGVIAISATGAGAGTVTSIEAGTGLSGGTITGAGTLSLASTGVAAATYGSISNYVPWFNVDIYGRLTSAGSLQISLNGNQKPFWKL